MESLQIKALLAGIFFGIWPLLMNRSGLNGNFSTVVFTGIVLLCVAPFALGSVGDPNNTKWIMAISAGVAGAIGLICFNGVLAKATAKNVSSLFVLMIVIQVSVPTIYNIVMNDYKITAIKGLGFALAIVAGVLLSL